MTSIEPQDWLRAQCGEYAYDLRGIFRVSSSAQWPLTATNASELEARMREHLLPLPKEPAALANVLEVSIVDFLLDRVDATDGALTARRGGERVYPDLEFTGPAVGGAFYAVDIKVAQRKVPKKGTPSKTQSRITLYTGNEGYSGPSHEPYRCTSATWRAAASGLLNKPQYILCVSNASLAWYVPAVRSLCPAC